MAKSGRRKVTSPLALAVLASLRERPMHPYEIGRLLRHRGKDESIKIRLGSLYTVVQNLEDRGLVAAEGTTRAGRRPERTVYRLTDIGREELEDRLRELISEPTKEYSQFEAALSLMMVLSPDEVVRLLTERLRLLEVEMAMTRAALHELIVEQHLPRLFLLETEYAHAMRRAEADWVRGAIAELSDGSIAGVEGWRTWQRTGETPAEWLGLESTVAGTDQGAGSEVSRPDQPHESR